MNQHIHPAAIIKAMKNQHMHPAVIINAIMTVHCSR